MAKEIAQPTTQTNLHSLRKTRQINIANVLVFSALLFVLLIFVGYFVVYLVYARALFSFPFDYDQGEGFELYDAIRLTRGENIYLDNAQFPFYSSNYPPVYRLMLVPLIWLFGPHLWVGRIVAFASSLMIGLLIFLAARDQFRRLEIGDWRLTPNLQSLISNLIPLLAALAFFAANYVYHVGPLARAHLPMVMFALVGIYFIDRAFDDGRWTADDRRLSSVVRRPSSWVGIGVGLLLVAGFTKLQAVDALVAGFLYLLIRKPRWFAVAFVASALVAACIVLVLNAATGGQFWTNVVSANVNEYDIQITWKTYAQWFQLQGVLIVCSVAFVVWDVVDAVRQRSFKPLTIWSLYFIAGSAMGMLTGKWGAGPTYLIAAIAVSCICTGGLIARIGYWLLVKDGRLANYHLPITAIVAAVIFFAQATLNVHLPTSGRLFGAVARLIGLADRPSSYPPYPYYDSIGHTQLGHLLDPSDAQNGWELVKLIRGVEGPVWSEEAMPVLLAGKDVVTNPTQLLNLSKNGMLDTHRMIEMIDDKAFGAVVFRALFYPDDVKEAIGRNYYWARNFKINGFDYWVLLPNGK